MKNTRRRSGSALLAAGCLGHLAIGWGAETANTSAPVIDTVVVTGTNIRGRTETAAPIQVVDRDQLMTSNAAQFSEVLQDVPANTGSALYNESGLLSGTAQFELRGLGFSSTLVLVNGRRAGVSPLSDKSGSDFLDINQFPLSMVERIEVLKDGASAIYGSEAVAGVVNVITRRGFEGLEVSSDFQSATNQAYSLNLAAGKAFDRGSFNVYATFLDQTGNKRSDFDWLIERVGGNGVLGRSQLITANGYPGTYLRANVNNGVASGVANAVSVPDPLCEQAGGVFRINDNGSVNRSICNADFTDQIEVIPSQQRMQALVEFNYDLTDELNFFNETSASRNINELDSTVGSFSNGSVASNVKGYIYVPASHPFNFFVADPANPRNLIYIDPSQWNPAIHQAVPVVGNFRPEGVNRSAEKRQENLYLRTLNGLNWQLSDTWQGSLSHMFAQARFEEEDPQGVDAQALNDLLAAGTYNPFATSIVNPTLVSPKDGVSRADNSDATLDQFFYDKRTIQRTRQHVVDASASGPVLELATGTVALAVGAQYRKLDLKIDPDDLFASGRGTVATTASDIRSSQDVAAAYVETIVPLYDRAQIQVAIRHEDYGGGVGSSTDPKIASRFEIIDGLRLRGSWGTSFQAPTLTQQARSQAYVIVNDPVTLGANGPTCSTTTVGSNTLITTTGENLSPQSSENFNVGLDWEPMQYVSMSADYWHYRYADLIAAAQNAQTIVSGECVNGVFVPDPRVVRGASGQLNGVNTEYVNVGKVVTDGIDVSTSLRVPAGSIGDFLFRADGTYINKFDVYGADGVARDKAGSRNFTNNFAPMPKWRASATTAWERGAQSLSLSVHFIDSYLNDQSNNAPIESFTTFGASYRLDLDGLIVQDSSTTISFGVDNIFDKDPPSLIRYTTSGVPVTGISAVDRPGYDPLGGADIRGRIFYARLLQQF